MITRPLDLKEHLRPPSRRFNFVPLLDVFFIALFFVMLSPRFVLSPGMTIDLPEAPHGTEMAGISASTVLTVRSDEMVLFEGRLLSPDEVGSALSEYTDGAEEATLLIYFDRHVSIQTLLSITETARHAGVRHVQLAAEPHDGADPHPVFR